MNTSLLLLFISLIAISSCAHINNLKDYDLSKKVILFEEVVGANAGQVNIDFGSSVAQPKSILDDVKNIAAAVGSLLLSDETAKKLQTAASPDSMAVGISTGVESNMVKYLRIKPIYELNDESKFIVTTTLENCKLTSSTFGIYVNVEATVRITDRNSGRIVWEYNDEESVQMKRPAYSAAGALSGFGDIAQVAELSSLTEEQIRLYLKDAAIQVGRNISEVLREDIAESK